MSERRFCTVYIPSGHQYTSAKRHDVTGAQGLVGESKTAIGTQAPVLLLSAMFGMYRHSHRSPGAGDCCIVVLRPR